mmetsp:Transcript_16518/g.42350  ORF Transcript_16518/g.42350 Transcript_16518/m.42350 type:complete len:229 (-) Transcript_16518:103-789(-)
MPRSDPCALGQRARLRQAPDQACLHPGRGSRGGRRGKPGTGARGAAPNAGVIAEVRLAAAALLGAGNHGGALLRWCVDVPPADGPGRGRCRDAHDGGEAAGRHAVGALPGGADGRVPHRAPEPRRPRVACGGSQPQPAALDLCGRVCALLPGRHNLGAAGAAGDAGADAAAGKHRCAGAGRAGGCAPARLGRRVAARVASGHRHCALQLPHVGGGRLLRAGPRRAADL